MDGSDIVLRAAYVQLCGGDHGAALLLEAFAQRDDALPLHQRGQGVPFEHSAAEFAADLLGLYAERAIRERLQTLAAVGWIHVTPSAQRRRATYALNTRAVHAALAAVHAGQPSPLTHRPAPLQDTPMPAPREPVPVPAGAWPAPAHARPPTPRVMDPEPELPTHDPADTHALLVRALGGHARLKRLLVEPPRFGDGSTDRHMWLTHLSPEHVETLIEEARAHAMTSDIHPWTALTLALDRALLTPADTTDDPPAHALLAPVPTAQADPAIAAGTPLVHRLTGERREVTAVTPRTTRHAQGVAYRLDSGELLDPLTLRLTYTVAPTPAVCP